jgi:hypothetical protein
MPTLAQVHRRPGRQGGPDAIQDDRMGPYRAGLGFCRLQHALQSAADGGLAEEGPEAFAHARLRPKRRSRSPICAATSSVASSIAARVALTTTAAGAGRADRTAPAEWSPREAGEHRLGCRAPGSPSCRAVRWQPSSCGLLGRHGGRSPCDPRGGDVAPIPALHSSARQTARALAAMRVRSGLQDCATPPGRDPA